MAKTRNGQPDVRADDGHPDEFTVLLAPREIADGTEREPHRHGRGRRRRRVWPWIVAAVVVLLLLAGGGLVRGLLRLPEPGEELFGWKDDYTGSGTGTVELVIRPGDLGSTVADRLAAAGRHEDPRGVLRPAAEDEAGARAASPAPTASRTT